VLRRTFAAFLGLAIAAPTFAFKTDQSAALELVSASPESRSDEGSADCSSFLELVQNGSTRAHWSPQKTAFDDSVGATVASSFFWLTLVETLRQSGHLSAILNPTFLRTSTVDSLISYISHRIGLGDIPGLQKLLEGKWAGSPTREFVARVGTNSVLNAAVISVFWAVSGVQVSPGDVLRSLSLCLGVYTGLQFFNNFFYKVFPFKRDCQTKACLVADFGEKMTPIFEASRANGRNLKFNEKEIEFLLISNLEADLTSKPYEEAVKRSEHVSAMVNAPELLKQLDDLDLQYKGKISKDQTKLALKQMKLRRKLLDRLLEVEKTAPRFVRDEIHKILSLGQPFDDVESLRFHRTMSERAKTYQDRIRGVSFFKQALAVGVAGGIFLYRFTYRATYGTWGF
jgi:hypothetical protein